MKTTKFFKKFFPIIFIVYLSGCEIKDFVSPSWDINANLPILNEVYTIFDILSSSSNYFIDSTDNSVVFFVDFNDFNNLENSLTVDGYSSKDNIFSLNSDTTLFLEFDDSTFVRYAEIREGDFFITMFNPSTESYTYNLTIQNLRDAFSGIPLNFEGTVAPNSSKEITSSLANYILDNGGKLSNELIFRIISSSKSTTFSSFDYSVGNSILNNISGKFKPTYTYDVLDTIFEPLGPNSPNVPLELAIVKNSFLNIKNYSDTRVKLLNIRIDGYNETVNSSVRLLYDYNNNGILDSNFVFDLPARGGSQFSETIITLTEFNSNIREFLGNMPSLIFYNRDMLVNEDYSDINVTFLDSVITVFNADVPMKFRSDAFANFRDTTFSEFSQNQKDEIVNSRGAKIETSIVNSIPLDLKIRISLQDNQSNTLLVLTNNLANQPGDSFAYLDAAQVDAQGIVLPGGESVLAIPLELNFEQIQSIRDFSRIVIEFNYKSKQGAGVVRVRGDDFLRIRAFGNLILRVNT